VVYSDITACETLKFDITAYETLKFDITPYEALKFRHIRLGGGDSE
jgi:hypothetical protein